MTIPRTQIVVALDESDYASIVLAHALDLAARHQAPDLHFITVVERGGDVDRAVRELASRVLPSLDGYGCTDWRARIHARSGRPHEEIDAFAADVRANFIVVGRFGLHHPGKYRRSVASRVIEGASCPVLVVGFEAEEAHAEHACADCEAVRADSDGERWFCDAHVAPDRVSVAPVLAGGAWTGGGLMW